MCAIWYQPSHQLFFLCRFSAFFCLGFFSMAVAGMAVSAEALKHLETQLPLLHLERDYAPHIRPKTDPVSGQTLPGQ
jgi:hypothetical protein